MDGLEEELGRLGARVGPQWLGACVDFLQGAQPGFGGAPEPIRAKAVLQQLLTADLNQCGAPALPPGVQALHDTVLPGKLLLQVDEVVNIAAAVRERYSGNDGGHRCLKLLLTDGVQQVAAVEYRPTPALHSAMPAGCKLVVQGAAVRRGMLLLTPQCCAVLGGAVPRLEDARRRMVVHWTQPAVGRRGLPPTMAQATAEATRAAWAGGPAPGAAGGRPPQQQMLQGPAANPQQQQPVAARPAPHQQQGPVAQRPSQQATQLASQPPQQQQQQPAAQQGVGPASGRLQPAPPGGSQQQQQRRPEVQLHPQPLPPPQPQHYPPQNFGGGGATGRAAGAGAATGAAAPLHDHNGVAAPSAGAKHSRLALSKPSMQAAPEPAAADFGFAQPPQQQPGARPGGPARAQPAAANPLAQRLRQATGVAAAAGGVAAAAGGGMQGAGTDDDPICLDGAEEGQQAQPGSSAGAAAEGDVAMAAADEQGGWDGDEGWDDEEAALAGPNLEPWEQGYGAAEDEEQLPDAEQCDDGSWEAEEGWEAAEGWQDGSGDAVEMEEDAAAGGLQDQVIAAAAGDEEGSWDDEMDAAEGAAPQAAPLAAAAAAAVRQPAAAQAAPMAPPSGKRRSSGSAVEVPRPSLRRQQQQVPQHDGLDGSLHSSRPPKQQQLQQSPLQPAQKHSQVQAAAATPAGGASTISSTLGLADLTVQPPSDRTHQVPRMPPAATTPQQPAQQPGEQQQQPASPHALGPLAVPKLEALSPSLLGAAPTLAEVLYSKPAAALEAAAPAAVAVASSARGSGGSGRAVPSVPALRGAPQRPAPSSGRGQLCLLSVSAPTGAAAWPAAASKRRAAAAAAPAISDDDMPSFALLDDMSPARPQLGAAPAAAVSQDEPFTYLLQLHRRAASAGPASFPLSARIFGTIRGINGKLGFTNPQTGQPEYTMNLEIEDGSLLVPAHLGSQFMREFFDVEPREFQALLADPARKLEGVELAKALQKLLSSYSGLIEVELEAPGRPLLVRNIGQELREDEMIALQRRAAGG